MYITVKKQFYKNPMDTECAYPIDVEDDIFIHESWDDAYYFHKLFYERTHENYGSHIINSPVIEDCRKGGLIKTEFVFRTDNGDIFRTVLETVEKVYE